MTKSRETFDPSKVERGDKTPIDYIRDLDVKKLGEDKYREEVASFGIVHLAGAKNEDEWSDRMTELESAYKPYESNDPNVMEYQLSQLKSEMLLMMQFPGDGSENVRNI